MDSPENIISLEAVRQRKQEEAEPEGYWIETELICIACHHRARHTFSLDLNYKDLECSGCGAVGFLINTGQGFLEELRESMEFDLD